MTLSEQVEQLVEELLEELAMAEPVPAHSHACPDCGRVWPCDGGPCRVEQILTCGRCVVTEAPSP
jgi:hypothetical protein